MSGLFVTRATLALAGRKQSTERGATRPYVVHQLVSDMFGDYEERPYLYRTEERRGSSQDVLVLSSKLPLDDFPGRKFGTVRSAESKPFALDVPSGTLLDFEVRLNATKDLVRKNRRSKRIDAWEAVWREDKNTPLAPEDVYGKYLQRKLSDTGRVLSAHVTARSFVRARRALRYRRPIRFVAANLIGTLEVQDASRLERTVGRGIGRSKAFGCGLLCLSTPGSILPRRYPDAAEQLYA